MTIGDVAEFMKKNDMTGPVWVRIVDGRAEKEISVGVISRVLKVNVISGDIILDVSAMWWKEKHQEWALGLECSADTHRAWDELNEAQMAYDATGTVCLYLESARDEVKDEAN